MAIEACVKTFALANTGDTVFERRLDVSLHSLLLVVAECPAQGEEGAVLERLDSTFAAADDF